MKIKLIGILVCMLLIGTVVPVSGTFLENMNSKAEIIDKEFYISNLENSGVMGVYKSLIDIPSPDGNKYNCLMYCNNDEQVQKWITQIDQADFDSTWQENIIKLLIFYFTPGTIILFGLDDFIVWFMELFALKKHKDEYLDFLDDYNDTGMISYIWFKSSTKTLIDFKIQPDNTWIEDSWIFDNGNYIPNPDIWYKRMPFVPF